MARRCENCIHNKVCNEWAVEIGMPFVNADMCEHYTADVVPKSEVNCIYAYDGEVEEYCVQSPCPNYKTIEQAKQEVAREIFEEIEKFNNACVEIGHFKGAWFNKSKFDKGLAELKKKYTESEDKG